MTIVLRDYQEGLITGARQKLREGVKRLLLQAPCGAGKTVIGAFIVKNASERGKRVTFMTHRGELAKQAAKTFDAVDIGHGYIMAAFTPNPNKRVQVAMIDTLRNRFEKLPVPDILMIDECHHAVSPSWQKVINHYAEAGSVIIGLSATPARLDGRPLNDIFDAMVLGPTVKELIDRGCLAKYSYYAPPQVADLDGVASKYGDYDQKELAERMDKPQVVGDAIAHYNRLLPGKRAIAFCVNIAGSKHLVEQFNAAGIAAAHVDGEMHMSERSAAIKAFERGDIKVLSNVSLFGEGFDVKACDGVILLRATQSLSLHIQMCGRAMRPHESKERAIIIDHVGNVNRHGLPDEDHEWTLEGKKKKAGKKKDEPVVPVAQCPKCFTVFAPAPCCPSCGHVMEKKRGQAEVVDGELQEITPQMAEDMKRRRAAEVTGAKSLDDLKKLAAQRGYSEKWADHIYAARQRKRESFQKGASRPY
jgi:superfamily II DNA or RNA helicase